MFPFDFKDERWRGTIMFDSDVFENNIDTNDKSKKFSKRQDTSNLDHLSWLVS